MITDLFILIKENFTGLSVSFAYATGLLLIAEASRKFFNLPSELTRKFIHVGAGMWVFGILLLFDNWQIGIIPFTTFIGINFLLYRYRVIGAMDTEDSSPGTIYFAISVALLFLLFWRPDEPVDNAPIAVAGVMAMTWGDALAALIGKRLGKHKYQIGQSIRSWEGSVAMFIASTIAIFLVLVLLPGSPLSQNAVIFDIEKAFLIALVTAIFATLAEAISPHGTDNLSVPLVAAGIVWVANMTLF
jgi:phytol kinase